MEILLGIGYVICVLMLGIASFKRRPDGYAIFDVDVKVGWNIIACALVLVVIKVVPPLALSLLYIAFCELAVFVYLVFVIKGSLWRRAP